MSTAPESPGFLARALSAVLPGRVRETLASPGRIAELQAQVTRLEETTAQLHLEFLANRVELERLSGEAATLAEMAEANRRQMTDVLTAQVAGLNDVRAGKPTA